MNPVEDNKGSGKVFKALLACQGLNANAETRLYPRSHLSTRSGDEWGHRGTGRERHLLRPSLERVRNGCPIQSRWYSFTPDFKQIHLPVMVPSHRCLNTPPQNAHFLNQGLQWEESLYCEPHRARRLGFLQDSAKPHKQDGNIHARRAEVSRITGFS